MFASFFTALTVGTLLLPTVSSQYVRPADAVQRTDAPVLTASIMSDDYTTYRRGRGDASRVG